MPSYQVYLCAGNGMIHNMPAFMHTLFNIVPI